MPFDGKDFTRVRQIGLMDEVISNLSSERYWCKNALYTMDGRRCILGAISISHFQNVEDLGSIKSHILSAAYEVTGKRYARIELFNDDRRTIFPTVAVTLRKAKQNIVEGKTPAIPVPMFTRFLRLMRLAPSY